MVTVDVRRCRAVADLLRGTDVPEDREETSLPNVDRVYLPNFLLLVVAICHQTTPATGEPPLQGYVDDRLLRGWDYLLRKLAIATSVDSRWVSVSAWTTIQAPDLRGALHDLQMGDRLTDLEGRSAMIRDLGTKMQAHGWSDASDIYRFCGRRIRSAEPNLVGELAQFLAYRDPVRKKTFYFLSLMQNFGLWQYSDPQNLGPPADYHEVRGHLRLGTVRIEEPSLMQRLMQKKRVTVEEDNLIRGCVVEAIVMIASELGITPGRAHYMFWNLFRNICTRAHPQCFGISSANELPSRYRPLTALAPSGCGCPFASVCPSAGREPILQDPIVATDFH